MEYQMAHKHRRSAQRCANTKMPETLTDHVFDVINNLRPSVRTDYLKKSIKSKYVDDLTAPAKVRRDRAIEKWLYQEQMNDATEVRLILTPEDFQILPRVTYSSFISFVQDDILSILGCETVPTEALIGSFSGGASTSRPRTRSYPAAKYLGRAHVTESAKEVFESIMDEMPGWPTDPSTLQMEVVRGNVMFTVPKKTDIDRVACKEPDLNMFLQKGIGNFISSRLKRIGIDLNDQSNNRRLARIGSIDGSLVTFDLSSASDSITTELVELLLPVHWFTLMDSVRSPITLIGEEEHRNCMFSSMGNGFTFELESLIFLCLTRAISYFTGTRGTVSIYGDDIICPSGISDILPFVFEWFGFSINMEKSCVSGPLRESCGGHYWNGLDITPFYIKEPIKTLVDLLHVANQLRAWGSIEGLSIVDPEIEDLWKYLASYVPKCLWGGRPSSSGKYQLVSSGYPHSRLSGKTESKMNGDGGYVHWLNTTWGRKHLWRDAVETSCRTLDPKGFELKKVDKRFTVAPLPALFLHELG